MEYTRNEINFIRYIKKYKPDKYEEFIFKTYFDKNRNKKVKVIDKKNESYISNPEY